MRKIAAPYIFPIVSPPIRNGVIHISDSGEIIDIIENANGLRETAQVEYYNGIIVPGFVNTHCHIELSYLKGMFGNDLSGLPEFLLNLGRKRIAIPENINRIIKMADAEMCAEGIVAVGDVSNNDYSFSVKLQSSIKYHTFLETYKIEPENAFLAYNKVYVLYESLNKLNLSASIVPHAPYSVSSELLTFIAKHYETYKGIFSIHNQETASENLLFENGSGDLYTMFSDIGIDMSTIPVTGKSSLASVIHHFPANSNVLLVHNIYTQQADIDLAQKTLSNVFWVMCPNSNLVIENMLPDIDLFMKNNVTIALGTDSYSSNSKLSILEEIKTISKAFPSIELKTFMEWATLNGAKALNFDNTLGSFEKGKKPGVNLITNIDFEKFCLTDESQVRVLQ
jgi:cytosine/adenosine deaminase-related metal-dependent hydrolase